MTILVAGMIGLDTIETPFGAVEDVLGGSAAYFAVAASHFSDVRVVAAVGEDFDGDYLKRMEGMGIDTAGVRVLPGRTSRWRGKYGYDLAEPETLANDLNVLEDYRPFIPEHYRDTEYVFLAHMDPEAQLGVLEQIAGPNIVTANTINYWIQKNPGGLKKLLNRVDILIINDSDLRELTAEPGISNAARATLDMGLEYVIVKRGVHGALMFSHHGIVWTPSYPLENSVDPTGGRDAFAGGFLGHIVKEGIDNYKRSIVYGAVLASFAIEDFSVEGLMPLTSAEIGHRFSAFLNLCKLIT